MPRFWTPAVVADIQKDSKPEEMNAKVIPEGRCQARMPKCTEIALHEAISSNARVKGRRYGKRTTYCNWLLNTNVDGH